MKKALFTSTVVVKLTAQLMISFIVLVFSINIANAAPTDILLDGLAADSINENRPIGSLIGKLSTVNQLHVAPYTYSTCTTPGADDAKFAISSSNLFTNFVFDAETNADANNDGIYEVCIKSDGGGVTFSKTFNITVNNIEQEANVTGKKSWDLGSVTDYIISDSSVSIKKGITKLTQSFAPKHVASIVDDNDPDHVIAGAAGLAIKGDYAYVLGHDNAGMEIIDISDPENLITVGQIVDSDDAIMRLGRPSGVEVVGDYAYIVCDNSHNLVIVDVSNPAAPTFVSQIFENGNSPLLLGAKKVKIVGRYAYIIAGSGLGLEIIDVIDAANPVHVGSIKGNGSAALLNRPMDLEVVGNYAYITSMTSDSLDIIDISDPAHPVSAGSIYGAFMNAPKGIDVVGDYAYITADSALVVLNISDPANPQYISTFGFFDGVPSEAMRGTSNVDVVGNYAYIITIRAVVVLDISDPADPKQVGVIFDEDTSDDLDINGGTNIIIKDHYAYISSNNGALGFERRGSFGVLNVSQFSPDKPYIEANNSLIFTGKITIFEETLSANNQGNVKYQLSSDDGVSWKYLVGSNWVATTKTDGTESTAASDVAANIKTLDTDGGKFKWRAYLESGAFYGVELDNVSAVSSTNTAPTITSNGGGTTAAKSIAENTTAVTTVKATDSDVPVQTLTYSISGGADSSKFTISSTTGVLAFSTAPDYESPAQAGSTDNQYVVEVKVSDGTLSDTQTLTVTVTDKNDAPTITSNGSGATASKSIAENTTAVTTVKATDSDVPAQTLTYSISGGADSSKFTISSTTGALAFSTAPDYENPTDTGGNNSYIVEVKVTDNGTGSLTDTQTLTVTVTDKNDAPTITSNGSGATASKSIAENTTAVTTVKATDSDVPVQTLTYSISGGADSSKFTISSTTGVLAFSTAPDYENPTDTGGNNSYIVEVKVTDNGTGSLTDTQTLTVTVTGGNDAPTITSNGGGTTANKSIAENTTAVTTVKATDSDVPVQTLTYSISGGADSSKFTISSTTGVLAFSTAPDYENPTDTGGNNSYIVEVKVTDNGTGSLTDTQTLTVTITDVAENTAPTITSNGSGATASKSIAENTTAVTTVKATDSDVPVQTLTYSISGGADSSKFTISSTTGVLAFSTAPDYENPTDTGGNNSYIVEVKVTDNGTGSLTDTQTLTVTVTGGNDAPTITSNGGGATANKSIAENTTAVTTVKATDSDVPVQTLAYSISGGADSSKFTISSTTGVLAFSAAPDYENPTDTGGNNSYIVEVKVTDNGTGSLTDTQTLTVTITDVAENTAPTITSNGSGATASKSIAENTTAVTTVKATDSDVPVQTLTYSISGGADSSKFTISSTTGVLAFSTAPDYESPAQAGSTDNQYVVEVKVSDGTLSDTQTLTITVTDGNDAALSAPNVAGAPLTKDSTPEITGSCTAGDIITIQVDGVAITPTAVCTAGGTYSVTPSTAIADGFHNFTATAKNATGVSPVSPKTGATIDTKAPDAPEIDTPTNGQPVKGSGEPGATVKVDTPSGAACTTVVKANGTWSCDLDKEPVEGEDVSATQTDEAGNESPETTVTGGIKLDDIPPAPPVIDPVTENTATITGTAEPGSTITISPAICSNTPIITDEAGQWECDTKSSLPLTVDSQITATATDENDNVSEPSSTKVTGDNAVAPTINPTDGTRMSGSGVPGSNIVVRDEMGNTICTAEVATTGLWFCVPESTVADGEEVSASMTDPNTGKVTGPATTTVVGNAEAKITLPPTVNPTDGSEVTGKAPKGSTVKIFDAEDGILLCQTTADITTGEYRCSPLVPKPENGDELNVIAIDKDTGTASAPATVIVDQTLPSPPQINPITEGDLTITGTTEAGNTVDLTGVDCKKTPIIADKLGKWSCQPTVAPVVGDIIKATATDPAGNVSEPATMPVTAIGGILPPVVSPTNGRIISGTGVAGATVVIKNPETGLEVCSALVDDKGKWSCKPEEELAVGTILQATQTKAGEESLAVSFVILDSAIVAPEPPHIDVVNSDSVSGSGDFPGDMIVVKDDTGKVLCTAIVNGSGEWSCNTNRNLENGENISAIAINQLNGSSSLPSFAVYDAKVEAGVVLVGLKGGVAGSFGLPLLFATTLILLMLRRSRHLVLLAVSESYNRSVTKHRATKKLFINSILVVLMLVFVAPVHAKEGQGYIGVEGGLSFFSPDTTNKTIELDDDSDAAYKLLLGYDFSDRWGVEAFFANLGTASFKPAGSLDYDVKGIGINYYLPIDSETFTLFIKGGGASLGIDAENIVYKKVNNGQIFAGIGVELELNKSFSLRAEYEYFDKDIQLLSMGLVWRFGGNLEPIVQPKPKPKPQVKPKRIVVKKIIKDSDHDGVIDSKDKCKNSPRGISVDKRGCSNFKSLLRGVYFSSGSATLTRNAKVVLSQMIVIIKKMKGQDISTVEIQAHTDSQGSNAYNQNLSQQRANSVKDYLILGGIDRQRLQAKGFGERWPVASNLTAYGRSQNRRVVFRLE